MKSAHCSRGRRGLLLSGITITLISLIMLALSLFRVLTIGYQQQSFFWNMTAESGALWYGWARAEAEEDRGFFGFHVPNEESHLIIRPRLVQKPANGVLILPFWMPVVIGLVMIGFSLKARGKITEAPAESH